MTTNEAKAFIEAVRTVRKALAGETFESAVKVYGGRIYDCARELCAEITAVAETIKNGGFSGGGGGSGGGSSGGAASAAVPWCIGLASEGHTANDCDLLLTGGGEDAGIRAEDTAALQAFLSDKENEALLFLPGIYDLDGVVWPDGIQISSFNSTGILKIWRSGSIGNATVFENVTLRTGGGKNWPHPIHAFEIRTNSVYLHVSGCELICSGIGEGQNPDVRLFSGDSSVAPLGRYVMDITFINNNIDIGAGTYLYGAPDTLARQVKFFENTINTCGCILNVGRESRQIFISRNVHTGYLQGPAYIFNSCKEVSINDNSFVISGLLDGNGNKSATFRFRRYINPALGTYPPCSDSVSYLNRFYNDTLPNDMILHDFDGDEKQIQVIHNVAAQAVAEGGDIFMRRGSIDATVGSAITVAAWGDGSTAGFNIV